MQQILRQRLKHEMTDLKNMDQEGKLNKAYKYTPVHTLQNDSINCPQMSCLLLQVQKPRLYYI